MKKVLVCTDFSTTAQHAVDYAALLCKKYKAELHIMHVFEVPFVFAAGAAVIAGNISDVQSKADKKMKTLAERLKKELKIPVKSGVVQGSPVNTILNTVEKHRYDVLVLGINGANKVKEILVGSTVVNLAGKTKCPLLVVPRGVKFNPFRHLLFASDDGKKLNAGELKLIKQWHEKSNLKLTQFSIDSLEDELKIYNEHELKELENKAKAKPFPFRSVVFYAQDIVSGMTWIMKKEKGDLLIVRARHHNFFSKLFGISRTAEISFKTKQALIILSEK
jgi:nucleotide-binding universal stress UspA family protein